MDDQRFDRLARVVAGGISRRRALLLIAGGVAGVLGRSPRVGAQAGCPVGTPCAIRGGSPCVVGTCQPDGTCGGTFVPAPVGTPCEPPGTTCRTGTCQADATCRTTGFASDNTPCTPHGSPCLAGVCRSLNCTGNLSTHAPDGTPCAAVPGNNCVRGTCQEGTCAQATPVTCPATDACHTPGACQPSTGNCVGGGTPTTCAAPGQCQQPGACDPVTGVCTYANRQNGTLCDADGTFCTRGDACQDGVCVAGSPVVCQPRDQCHLAGTCNPVTGTCSHPTEPDGTACDDGNPCTTDDACTAGICGGTPDPTCVRCDLDPAVCASLPVGSCQEAFCDSTGICGVRPQADGSPCDDGNACTNDTCQNGVCQPGAPRDCTALDSACARGVCDPTTGACVAAPINEGLSCDDGNACTQTDTCQAGTCVGSNPVVCAAQGQCHVAGVCDPLTGTCSNPAAGDGTLCNADESACTVGDACQGGACVAGPAVVCPAPLDACHAVGTCDPASGICSEPTLAVGTCKSGRIKDGPCDCDGACCAPGNNCVGKPGERRCQEH